MKKFSTYTNRFMIGAMLVAAVSLAGYQTFGYRPASPAPSPAPTPQAGQSGTQAKPTAVATFDLEKTFNALDEKKAADTALLKLAEDMNTKGDEQSKAIKQMQEDLKDHQVGAPKWKELSEKIAQASLDFRAYMEFCKAKIDIQRARSLKRIYQHIRDAIKIMAEERGYSVVYVDDSVSEIPAGNEEETTRQITARRIVYSNPDVNITNELIGRMNADFKNKGGVAAQPTAANPALGNVKPAPPAKPGEPTATPVKKP